MGSLEQYRVKDAKKLLENLASRDSVTTKTSKAEAFGRTGDGAGDVTESVVEDPWSLVAEEEEDGPSSDTQKILDMLEEHTVRPPAPCNPV